MQSFHILSIDGGGLRGVVPVLFLKKIEAITGKRIHELFHLVAGTSTGGLITAALTIKNPADPSKPLYSLDDIMNIYIHRGHEIFPERNGLGKMLHNVEDLLKPKFSADGIDRVFRDVLKNYRLQDCLSEVMICTYDLNNNVPLFLKSRVARQNPAQNALLYDACRATSAGPSYLPSYPFVYPNDGENPNRNCIDGGVYINNPSMAALAEYSKHFQEYQPGTPATATDIDYSKVFVLSLGTGSYNGKVKEADTLNKGEVFWANHISDIMMRGVNSATDYAMKEMMEPDNYLRITVDIDNEEHSEMSNASSATTQYLLNAAQQALDKNEAALEKMLQAMLAN